MRAASRQAERPAPLAAWQWLHRRQPRRRTCCQSPLPANGSCLHAGKPWKSSLTPRRQAAKKSLEIVRNPFDAILEQSRAEVDDESKSIVEQNKVGLQLSGKQFGVLLRRLQFDDKLALDNQVCTIGRPHVLVVPDQWYVDFGFDRQS